MKILTFAASNSSKSINGQLVDYANNLIADGLVPDAEVMTIDLNDYEMPIYSSDREDEGGVPQLAHDFFNAVGEADAVIVSFAEHNGNYTTAYKNIFDWASRINRRVFQDKPAVIVASSAGPGGGRNVLKSAVTSGPHFGYDVKASVSIPSFYENFDSTTGAISNPELDAEFKTAVGSLA